MAKTFVFKIGSSTLTTSAGKLDLPSLRRIVKEIAAVKNKGDKVIIVSSGAIVCGAEKLSLGKPKTIPEKQAAAAVGQSRLMRQYEKAFESHGLITAQVLMTSDLIHSHEHRTNARNTLNTLLKERVVPIVNENDTVATDEIKIGDNDTLAALTANLVKADTLIILSDVNGFMLAGKLLSEIKEITREIRLAAGQSGTDQGTGGMVTKLAAYKTCRQNKIKMHLINGRQKGLINQLVFGTKKVGTTFWPS
ncbi:glutamate 5-kinase [Candidatus Saganbacteria bacterium CG08_land_8_20_14_0_20_45_16]|uniref:Glutamate 5-kinase n=1 Tax=Candidatus Saganbacteria bacterium CG08_land_8_20_14_0_20_45_16 TaxID=2014293 RepID=A0A2H0XZ11_UNCSA|nr:MAG: glutamate 5-kinase [Candidatus Saganbacteria bacterium CG08_land_8_20_14_0_20_45_16]